MSLPQRSLGNSGVSTSALGFGVSGPHSTGFTTKSTTIGLVRRALELGVRVFDTAPFYGDGVAERRMGEALADMARDELFLSTKAGTVVSPGGRLVKDFTPIGIRAVLETSLNRLRTDYIDTLFLHGPAPGDIAQNLVEFLARLKREGLVRLLGVCGRGAEIDAALETGVFDLIMTPVRLDMPASARERISRIRAAGLGVLGIEALAPSQARVRIPRRPSDFWYAARGVVRGGGAPRTLRRDPADCLRWALCEGGADIVVTSTVRRAHLSANVANAIAALGREAPLDATPAHS